MKKKIAYIHKINGEVQDREKLLRWFNRYLDTCPNGDQLLEFVSAPRSDQQNKFYWVAVGEVSEHLGAAPMEMHEYFKTEFLPKEEYFVVIKKIQAESTTTLNKDQMAVFLDNVLRRCAELGKVIQDPEEYKHMN